MFVTERYVLPDAVRADLMLRQPNWGFGLLSEAVFYRTYSRRKPDGGQETWADTVIRVVEGVMSIYKQYVKHWDPQVADYWARRLADSIYEMRFLPPGRGLWAMGTEYIFERGSMALNNCAFYEVTSDLGEAAEWIMNALMNGVGVGFRGDRAKLGQATRPLKLRAPHPYIIPDTREGWARSVDLLISSYFYSSRQAYEVTFDYSLVRPEGAVIKGFGGVASGPRPLKKLHRRVRALLNAYVDGRIGQTRLIADVINAIGACVVAGNVRRSAEIFLGSGDDPEFLGLKDYDAPRYGKRMRAALGWMSNNSVVLRESADFDKLPRIAEGIARNGEPGFLNLLAVQKYGRTGEKMRDWATGANPCGEIPLESGELCNLVEVFPTRCENVQQIRHAMAEATFYATVVSMLPTESSLTNAVMSRNRRIGVSVSGIADWIDATSVSHVFRVLNEGYDLVRSDNAYWAKECGINPAIRVTTVKPSGTISLLAGVSAGMHWPHAGYIIRRVRVSMTSPVVPVLQAAGIPWEVDESSDNTYVFEFPLQFGRGKTRSQRDVSVWEQAATVAMLQRCWADNMVSNTIKFQPEEAKYVERVLATFAPQVKSMSMLPDTPEGAYPQMPEERITKKEYESRVRAITPPDWSVFHGDGQDSKFCNNDSCEI